MPQRLGNFISRARHFAGSHARAIAITAFLVGVVWRAYYILIFHPPNLHIGSDSKEYVDRGIRLFSAGYQQVRNDTIWPIGSSVLYGLLYKWGPNGFLANLFQWFTVSLLPLLIADIARSFAFGEAVALLSLIMASLYFPFIDYASYFLSEHPFTFFMVLSVCLFARAIRQKTPLGWYLGGFLSGLAGGAAVAMRSTGLVVGLCVGLFSGWIARRYQDRPLAAALVGVALGWMALQAPMAARCTRLSQQFCLDSNNAAMNIALGHAGEIRSMFFVDSRTGESTGWLPPSMMAHRGTETVTVPYGVFEPRGILRWVAARAVQHPMEVLTQSITHVFDLFYGPVPWPTAYFPQKIWAGLFQQLFVLFILLPVIFSFWSRRVELGRFEKNTFHEWLLLMPLFVLMAVSFVTMGEPRYRIPFDGFLMILASRVILGPAKSAV